MRLPRNLSGKDLAKLLGKLGYEPTRQSGSHVRLTTKVSGEHHITIPMHDFLRIGTLSQILGDIAFHFKVSKEEILKKIFTIK